jgi:hypothetical protein
MAFIFLLFFGQTCFACSLLLLPVLRLSNTVLTPEIISFEDQALNCVCWSLTVLGLYIRRSASVIEVGHLLGKRSARPCSTSCLRFNRMAGIVHTKFEIITVVNLRAYY